MSFLGKLKLAHYPKKMFFYLLDRWEMLFRDYPKNSKINYEDPQIQYNVAWIFFEGDGVRKNLLKAFKWWRKAAAQGHVGAMAAVGDCYSNGEGVKRDREEAAEWYIKAAHQGHANVQLKLSALYSLGRGVRKDEVEAEKWCMKAAEQGNVGAQYMMGLSYYSSKQDRVKWFRKAAEQGYGDAQSWLGHYYMFGDGVETNHLEAYIWISLARKSGENRFLDYLKVITKYNFLSPEQLKFAKREARRRFNAIKFDKRSSNQHEQQT